MKYFYLLLRVVAALIMLQTLYFKFSGSEESIYIFSTVGKEPWGRIMVGVFELIASILILLPRTVWMGALLTIGLMLGAVGMHLTLLGIEVQGDGGYLFFLALVVLVCGVLTLWKERNTMSTSLQSFRHN